MGSCNENIVIYRDVHDKDTFHFATKRTYKPEQDGPLHILLSIHIDPLSDLVVRETRVALTAMRPGEHYKAELALTIKPLSGGE